MCGVYLNRARVVNIAFFIPMSLFFFLTEEIMIAAGQDPATAAYSETYVTIMLPGLFFLFQRHCTNKFLQACGVFRPQMYVTICLCFVHICTCYLLVIVAGLGIAGAALSMTIYYTLSCFIMFFYAKFSEKTKHTVARFDRSAFQNLSEILKYGMPNAAMYFFEHGSAEI